MRPSLPVLLFPAAALWVSLMLAEAAVWRGSVCADGVWLPLAGNVAGGIAAVSAGVLAAAGAIAGFACWRRGRSAMPLMISASVCLGFFVGLLYWESLANTMEEMPSSGTYSVEVMSDCNRSSVAAWSEGKVAACSTIAGNADLGETGGMSANVRIIWDSEDDALPLGTCFVSSGRFARLGDASKNEGRFQNGIAGNFYPANIEQTTWANSLQGVFGSIRQRFAEMLREHPGEGEVLLEGVVLGNRSQLSGTELDESFKVSGLSHLLAVSGSHLSVVAMMTAWLLGKTKVSRKVSIALLCFLVVSYLILTGMQPSAFRACAMSLMGSAAWIAGRRRSSMPALCLAVMLMLALDPSNAFSVGFGLSVMGVLGICAFLPLAESWLAAAMPNKLLCLAQPLGMTLVAQASTSQISVPIFGMVSVIGPFMNIVASPAISAFLGAGIVSMTACAVCEPVGQAMLHSLCSAADAFCMVVEAAASFDHAAIPAYVPVAAAWIAFVVVAALAWAIWPVPTKKNLARAVGGLLAVCLVVAALSFCGRGTQVVMLDVGQGDAILVRDGASQVLVDTGRSDSKLRAALGRNGVYRLDAVVITHFDDDHCGSLGALRSMVAVDKVVLAAGSGKLAESGESGQDTMQAAAKLAGAQNIVEVSRGDRIRLSEHLSMTVVWPEGNVEKGGNAESLCAKLEYDHDLDGEDDFAMLLTGDAESEQLQKMVDAGLGHVDAIKVGHHGSAASSSNETLDALRPSIALISVGAGNTYGHPSSKTLNLLEAHGIEYWRTDLNGDVALQLAPWGCRVSCANI